MTRPLLSPVPPIALLVARLTPSQCHLILQLNMAYWQHEHILPTPQQQGLMLSLYRLGMLDATTRSLTHQGVLVAGYLTLQCLRQDP